MEQFKKKDVGGLDIIKVVDNNGLLVEEVNGTKTKAPGPTNNKKDFPLVKFGSARCRVPLTKLGYPYLDERYGKKWKLTAKSHPSLF